MPGSIASYEDVTCRCQIRNSFQHNLKAIATVFHREIQSVNRFNIPNSSHLGNYRSINSSSISNYREPSLIPDIDPIPLLTDPPLRKFSTTALCTQPTLPKELQQLRNLRRIYNTTEITATKPLQNQRTNPSTNSHTTPATKFTSLQWSKPITMSRSPALIST